MNHPPPQSDSFVPSSHAPCSSEPLPSHCTQDQVQGCSFQNNEKAADTCPITHQRFIDPVVLSDGFTYERQAIVKWLKTNNTSPLTRETVGQRLIPNRTLCQLLDLDQSSAVEERKDDDGSNMSHDMGSRVETVRESRFNFIGRGNYATFAFDTQHFQDYPTYEQYRDARMTNARLQPTSNQMEISEGEHNNRQATTTSVNTGEDEDSQLDRRMEEAWLEDRDSELARRMEEAFLEHVRRAATSSIGLPVTSSIDVSEPVQNISCDGALDGNSNDGGETDIQ